MRLARIAWLLMALVGCGRTITAPKDPPGTCKLVFAQWTDPDTGWIYTWTATYSEANNPAGYAYCMEHR